MKTQLAPGGAALRVALACMLCALLVCAGCTATPAAPPVQPTATPEQPTATPEQTTATPEQPESQIIPWGEQASITEQAVNASQLIFCFMSGEGTVISGGSSTSAFGDTKWGDSTLIAFPNGETMLIDGGMADYAPLLIDNLKALGVQKLDHVVLSHRHDDHYGALLCMHGVLDSFETGTIYSTGIYNGSASDPAKLEGKAGELGVETLTLKKDDTLEIGGVSITVLWPDEGRYGESTPTTEDTNNSSLVLRFDYGEVSALFTGDLYKSGEMELIKLYQGTQALDADILKIPHHGRPTSSSRDFMDAVTPGVAVALGAIIMDTTTYSGYVKSGARVLMDVYDGYVKVATNGVDISLECSRVRSVETYDKIDAAFSKTE